MSADTPTHWLDCPDCSCRVFTRVEDLFGDGESEHCRACGSLVTISTDAESPVDVRVDEHGGAVVARLRAESTVLASVVEALEDPARPEESPVDAVRRLRAEIEQLTWRAEDAETEHADALAYGNKARRELSAARAMVEERDGLLVAERDANSKISEGFEQLVRERDAAVAHEGRAIETREAWRHRAEKAERERDKCSGIHAFEYGPGPCMRCGARPDDAGPTGDDQWCDCGPGARKGEDGLCVDCKRPNEDDG